MKLDGELKEMIVKYYDNDVNVYEYFVVLADDIDHAKEQCYDAYGHDIIITGIFEKLQ